MHPRVIGPVIVLAALAISESAWTQSTKQVVVADGQRLHVRVIEPQLSGPSSPTVVMEAGLGDSAGVWNEVIGVLPRNLRIITYDRPGLGTSEDDHEPPTPRRIASLLYEALQAVGARPPYVLVGHSFGAARMRMFAGMYPTEVAGLVFVDPTDFTARRDNGLRDVWIALGHGVRERDEFERLTVEQMKNAPEMVLREFDVARRASLSDYEEFRTLPSVPDVPLVILVVQQKRPPRMQVSFDLDAWYQKAMAVRVSSLTRLAAVVTRSEVIITSNPDHGLHRSDPDLVAWAITRVIQAAK